MQINERVELVLKNIYNFFFSIEWVENARLVYYVLRVVSSIQGTFIFFSYAYWVLSLSSHYSYVISLMVAYWSYSWFYRYC